MENLIEEIKTWGSKLIHKDSLFLVITVHVYAAIIFFFLGYFLNSDQMFKFFQYTGAAVVLNFVTMAAVSGLTGRPYFMNYSDKQLQEHKQREE